MRVPQLSTVGLATLLHALLPAQETPSPAATSATLTAITPITAAWLNPPTGTSGAIVTHPAGPVIAASVSAPVGMQWASFQCNLAATGDSAVMTATSLVFAPAGAVVRTNADLLLVLTAPPTALGTIDIGLAHLGDTPDVSGFRIDVGNDGSDELDSGSQFCCGTVKRRVLTRSFANGPWLIRIRNDNLLAASPQAYDLRLEFRIELAGVTDLGSDCGPPLITPPTTFVYSTNSQLAARPSPVPSEFGVLHAAGLGQLNLFLFADQPWLVSLPLPPFGSCDLLATTQFGDPGMVVSSTAVASEWAVHLPQLPPGFTFHSQHITLSLGAPQQFSASNVLRIDT